MKVASRNWNPDELIPLPIGWILAVVLLLLVAWLVRRARSWPGSARVMVWGYLAGWGLYGTFVLVSIPLEGRPLDGPFASAVLQALSAFILIGLFWPFWLLWAIAAAITGYG